MRRALLVVVAVLMAGCGPSFAPASFLADFRIIGIKAEPPDLKPGETSTLTVVHSPLQMYGDGGEPTIDFKFEWYRCTRAPVISSGLGVNPDCLDDNHPEIRVALPSEGDHATVVMPDVMPATASLPLGLPDSTGGFYVPIVLRATLGEKTINAVYKLRVNVFGDPNHNPQIDQIAHVLGDYDGGTNPDAGPLMIEPFDDSTSMPLDVYRSAENRLRATVTEGSAEPYQRIDNLMPLETSMTTELPRFDWYTTAGEFSEEVTGQARPDTKLTFKEKGRGTPKEGDLIDLFVVVHDERGGVDYTHRTLRFHDQ